MEDAIGKPFVALQLRLGTYLGERRNSSPKFAISATRSGQVLKAARIWRRRPKEKVQPIVDLDMDTRMGTTNISALPCLGD